MKAFTIWQPWASLIVIGAKPYEFRGWYPPESIIGARLGLHAAARPLKIPEVKELAYKLNRGDLSVCLKPEIAVPFLEKVLANPTKLPLSHMLATAILGKPKRGDECAHEFGIEKGGNDRDRPGTFNWGWPMLDIQPFEPPIEARGAQGFWNWSRQE